jgi:hypothetical protein
MRRLLIFLVFLAIPSTAFAQQVVVPPTGRYQLLVVPNHSGSPFLLDTTTGCIWHLIQHQETKRSSFIEVDVENLHWSWGSGAQQLLAARIDSSELAAEQKRALKQELQRTGCGLSNVVLTPGLAPAATPTPEPSPSKPATPPTRPGPSRR